jgi:hypothetical protein
MISSYRCRQRIRRPRDRHNHVSRQGNSEQRKEHGNSHTLFGTGAPRELTAVQLTNPAHMAPCR